jgi:hypothetical protein
MALVFNPKYDITLDETEAGFAVLMIYHRDAAGLRDGVHSAFHLAVAEGNTALEIAQGAAPFAFIDEEDL